MATLERLATVSLLEEFILSVLNEKSEISYREIASFPLIADENEIIQALRRVERKVDIESFQKYEKVGPVSIWEMYYRKAPTSSYHASRK